MGKHVRVVSFTGWETTGSGGIASYACVCGLVVYIRIRYVMSDVIYKLLLEEKCIGESGSAFCGRVDALPYPPSTYIRWV